MVQGGNKPSRLYQQKDISRISTHVSLLLHWLNSPCYGAVVSPIVRNDHLRNKENTIHNPTFVDRQQKKSHYTIFFSQGVPFHVY